ncbi:MAG: 16S rRNA (adenine(1518)-N(6)/adenine(1519)-N(6))-dimethyltransferase RsmA [Acidobacteriota bacterium]|nr:16S rRNA (adenine(1518)-N(6)/adenine(1519)-N(6))-dimethyltransferase RsmA [Acidobacteriota bacterium]
MPVPLRRFSQNWLANDELAVALVRSMKPRSGDHFLEIGGGEGRMTRALLQHDVRVTTIEVDKRCCETLEALARNSAGKLSVIHSDILEYDPPKSNGHELRFVGNLPYAIASPILRWTVEHHKIVSDAYYMVPMDIAKRILAAAGSSERALLSVLIGWFFDGKMLRRLGPGAFRPEPKIKSAFVRLQPHEPPSCAARRQHWETVVQGSFAHRRKTLLNSLRQSGWQRDEIERALAAVDIDISTRAESLKVIQFARLAEELPELVQ